MTTHLLEQEISYKRLRNFIIFGTLWLPVFTVFFFVVIGYFITKCTEEEIDSKQDAYKTQTPTKIETSTVSIPKAIDPPQKAKNLPKIKINEVLLSSSSSFQDIREPDDFTQLEFIKEPNNFIQVKSNYNR